MYKKDLHDPDNHDGVITHLEPNILECEVKWALESITTNKASGFSSGHVWMWELDCEESWAPKYWCFWTVVLVKTLESPLDCKEIQPVHPKGYQWWVFIGRIVAEAETPILWPLHAKSWHRPYGRKWRGTKKPLDESERGEWKKLA